MISVEVSQRGLELSIVANKLSSEVRQKLIGKLADIAWASAFYGAPWKTGKLAGSIVKDVGEGEATIQALAPYAVFVVKGTAPHEIRPMNASVLAFETGGGMVFTRLVRHPGTRPNPFMQRATDATRDKVEETFTELWLELIG